MGIVDPYLMKILGCITGKNTTGSPGLTTVLGPEFLLLSNAFIKRNIMCLAAAILAAPVVVIK